MIIRASDSVEFGEGYKENCAVESNYPAIIDS